MPEDVVQDASLRAFRAIRGYAGGSARAWLLSIVRNTAYSWLRKNRPTAVVTVDDLEAVELVQATQATRMWTHRRRPFSPNRRRAAPRTIAALPAPFRETLVLRDIEGLDYREIAQTTEAPIGTVMSRLARGRRRLTMMLGAQRAPNQPRRLQQGRRRDARDPRMSVYCVRRDQLASAVLSRIRRRALPSAPRGSPCHLAIL